jgi:hypothetical protein
MARRLYPSKIARRFILQPSKDPRRDRSMHSRETTISPRVYN